MTQAKLLELYKKLQNGKMTVEQIVELRNLSDEDINIVLTSKRPSIIVKLLECKDLKKLPIDTQNRIISMIDKYNVPAISVIYAVKVATDKNVIESGHILELVDIVLTATETAVETTSHLVCHPNAIATGHIVELAKLVSKSNKESEQINFGYYASVDKRLRRVNNIVEIVGSILSANDKKEAIKIYNRAIGEAKKIKLMTVLAKGKIDGADFWELFTEDSDKAIEILNGLSTSIPKIEDITITDLKSKTYIQEQFVPLDMYSSRTASRENPEISPYARVRINKPKNPLK